jgi:hypothetical protein
MQESSTKLAGRPARQDGDQEGVCSGEFLQLGPAGSFAVPCNAVIMFYRPGRGLTIRPRMPRVPAAWATGLLVRPLATKRFGHPLGDADQSST